MIYLNELVLEGRAIQQRFNGKPHRDKLSRDSDSREAYLFAKLMFEGKTKPALDLLSGEYRGEKLHLNDFVDVDETYCTRGFKE